jgi:hypothetical protein
VGGIGLIACGVVGIVRGSMLGMPGAGEVLSLIADLLWAAAVLVFAVGATRDASVVARKPLGLAAMTIVAVWPLTHTIVGLAVPGPQTIAETNDWLFWWYLSLVLPIIAGLIAAVQIARAGTVPRPWNRAPLWVLAGQVVLWVLPQVIGLAAPEALLHVPGVLAAAGTLGFLAGTLGLGILATVLAARSPADTVEIFRSTAADG